MCPRVMEAPGDLTTGQGVGVMGTRKVSLTSRPIYKSLPQAMQLDMLEAGSGESSEGPEALLLALGRSLESLPSDIANGIKNGKVYLAKSDMPWCCILAAGKCVRCCLHRQVTLVALMQVSAELLQKYLDLEKNIFLKFFLRFAGVLAGLLCSV